MRYQPVIPSQTPAHPSGTDQRCWTCGAVGHFQFECPSHRDGQQYQGRGGRGGYRDRGGTPSGPSRIDRLEQTIENLARTVQQSLLTSGPLNTQ